MKDKIKLIIWDFSRTLLLPKDPENKGFLLDLYTNAKDIPFKELFYINLELIRFIEGLDKSILPIIFTASTLQDNPDIYVVLAEVFFNIDTTDSIGYPKSDTRSYEEICKKYNVKPSEVLFIDDTEANIVAANQLGIRSMQYRGDNEEIIRFVKENIQ